LFFAFSTKFIIAFWDQRWLMIQVEQERCSIMDAVQLAPEDRVRKKNSAKSKFLLFMKLSMTT
jgi:hypothetical protein